MIIYLKSHLDLIKNEIESMKTKKKKKKSTGQVFS